MTDGARGGAPNRVAAVLWIALAALALIVGGSITLPGIDGELLAEASRLAGTSVLAFPVIGVSTRLFVFVRIVLAVIGKDESRRAWIVATALYLGLTAVQVFAIALWAESAGSAMPFGDLVPEPGWRFRLIAVLTGTAGAAVVWWIADRIDATRAATGSLAVAFFAAGLTLVREASAFAQSLAIGERTPLSGATLFTLPLAMLAIAVALAIRTPSSWPIQLTRGLELRSGFDAVAIPGALAVLAGASAGPLGAPGWLQLAMTLAGALALVAFLRARTTRAPRRALSPLAFAIAAFLAVAVPLAVGLGSSDAFARALAPGPLEGEASFRITLAAVDRFRDGEAEIMVDRLRSLGAEASIVSQSPQRITLRVDAARDVESVLEALRPHMLALHVVDPPPSGALPAGIRRTLTDALEGGCDDVRAFAPNAPCTGAVEVIHDPYEVTPACRFYCLDPTPVVTGDDVTEASVTAGYDGRPAVTILLREGARERLSRATTENVSRALAIVVDGEVSSAPIIRAPITGGRAQIDLGGYVSDQERLAEANTLARALVPGHRITSAWTYEALDR